MFRWRKKNEGFEWREYVRTTILVRRKHRQEKIDEAKQAAVDGIKDAGRRSAVAGQAAAKSFGSVMLAALAVLARLPGKIWTFLKPRLRAVFAYLGGILRTGDAAARNKLSRGASHAGSRLSGTGHKLKESSRDLFDRIAQRTGFLQRPEVHLGLLLIGGIALLSFFGSVAARGFSIEALVLGVVALVALGITLGPKLAQYGSGHPASERIARAFAPVRNTLGAARDRFPLELKGGLVLGAVGMLFIGGAAYFTQGGGFPSLPFFFSGNQSQPLEGTASVLSGDTLKIGSTTVKLAGIEAPEARQTCLRQGNRRWRCGAVARDALTRMVRGKRVTCDAPASSEAITTEAHCQLGDRNIAEDLVSRGHVFASVGLFSRYSGAESGARAAKLGIWQGEADRPADYRAKRWEEARRAAPDGCPIKGAVTSSGRVYVLPWGADYDRARVRAGRGERWFCTEAEAQAAGWRPTGSS